jgi:hypothetical protein
MAYAGERVVFPLVAPYKDHKSETTPRPVATALAFNDVVEINVKQIMDTCFWNIVVNILI